MSKSDLRRVVGERMPAEIWVVPFCGQGHLFPCIELCKQLVSRNFNVTLLISSHLSSNLPSSLAEYPSLHVTQSPGSETHHPIHDHNDQLLQVLDKLLSTRPDSPHPPRPVFAVVDIMMSWATEVFKTFEVPVVAFFTSGACSAASEYAIWKAHPDDMKPGEVRLLPGLPEEMSLSHSDIQLDSHVPPPPPPPPVAAPFFPRPPGAPWHPKMEPPIPGRQPPWVDVVSEAIALLFNTCHDLETPFMDYVKNQFGRPVWAVGPLLPEQYWKSAGSPLQDSDVRKNRLSRITEDQVIQWLDSKPRGSVLYVSFGSEVAPTTDEYQQLTEALESTDHPFIWVLGPGSSRKGQPPVCLQGKPDRSGPESGDRYFPHGLDGRVGQRGLIISDWAPQLLILSHPSTGGFLSHCGWNSTVEAMGCGIPFLVWPIVGDQHHNAKLLVQHLKVGYKVSPDLSKVKKEDIVMGISRLMGDKEMKERAQKLSAVIQRGFPNSSANALDAFKCYICQKFP